MEIQEKLSESEFKEALELMALAPPEEHLREMLEGLHTYLQRPLSDLVAVRLRRGVRVVTACLQAKTSHVPGQTGV